MNKRYLIAALLLVACALAFSGVFATMFGLVVLICLHEFGHWLAARCFGIPVKVFSVGFGSSPRLYLGKFWGTDFQVTPWLLGGFVSIDPSAAEFSSLGLWKRAVVMSAGVAMNFAVAILIFAMLFVNVGVKEFELRAIEVQSLTGVQGPAASAGLLPGDQIVAVAGRRLSSPQDFLSALEQNKNSPLSLSVLRAGQEMSVDVLPDGDGHIGIKMSLQTETVYHKIGSAAAVGRAVSETASSSGLILRGLGMIFGLIETPAGLPAGASDVHGIISVVQWGSDTLSAGAYGFLSMMALLSINLAVFNILPLPVLDGGHLLFLGIEALRGRALSIETHASLNQLFMALLFALFFLGIFNDLAHPVSFG